MTREHVRDSRQTRRRLLEGLLLARVPSSLECEWGEPLRWAYEMSVAGLPLPPSGFISDVGRLACGTGQLAWRERHPLEHFPAGLVCRYEDHVLARLSGSVSFQRAADAMVQYDGPQRDRAVGFLVGRFCQRAGLGAVRLSPAAIRPLLALPEGKLRRMAVERSTSQRAAAGLARQYRALISALQSLPVVVAEEDLLELEQGTAVVDFAHRVALHQTLRAEAALEQALDEPPAGLHNPRRSAPTHLEAQDDYPVGGFASISNRGAFESLLHSQLAFMEDDGGPDLFDARYARGELLYYARDENVLHRERLNLALVLDASLVEARRSDESIPWQRTVLLLALLRLLVRRLDERLGPEALAVEWVLNSTADAGEALREECELAGMLFSDQVSRGQFRVEPTPFPTWRLNRRRQPGGWQAVLIATASTAAIPTASGDLAVLDLSAAEPRLALPGGAPADLPTEGLGAWAAIARRLLKTWLSGSASLGNTRPG